MKQLHLDSEYRRRWIEFQLASGAIEDSRQKNWRQVAWEDVIEIRVFMNGKRHIFKIDSPAFRFFMNFRWGGSEPVFDEFGAVKERKPIHIWTVGWTDGKDCFLTDIDFFTGDVSKRYRAPLAMFRRHIHPRVGGLCQ